MSVRRLRAPGLAVAALTALLVSLVATGCGPDDPAVAGSGPSATSAAGAGAGGGGGGGGRADDCLAGTWNVDLAALATQAAGLLRAGGTGTGEGVITVTFADKLTIHYADTLILLSPSSTGMKIGVKDTYAGDAVSTDYTAKGGKIMGTMPVQTVTKTTAVVVGTQTQPASSGTIAGTLDLANGLTNYTCSGSTATINNGTVTWKLTKA